MTLSLSRFILLAFAFLLAIPSSGFCQTAVEAAPKKEGQAKDHATEIEKLISAYHDNGQFNGSVLVAEKGVPILRQGFGMANMEWEIPNGPDTKFRIGSVTKQFTAALIMQLVEEGEIKLDEPITTYLTDYRKDTGDKVTTHHLLNHTSGIPSYTTGEFFQKYSRDSYELDEFVKRFASGDLEFEPGEAFSYSNSGYHLLGAIIEKVSGKSYKEMLEEKILAPAGMSDSGFDVSATILKNRAQGYEKTAEGYRNAPYLDMGIPYSAGSMYSTVDDLMKWEIALRENKLLSAESKALMYKPGKRNYGYGLGIDEYEINSAGEKTRVVQHGGGINGFNCRFSMIVDQNHTVVILDNVGMGQYHEPITRSIVKILNDQPYSMPKKSIADSLGSLAVNQGGAAAVAKYRQLKTDSPDSYDFDNEAALNEIGYLLLGEEKFDDAIELFKLNVEMFPEAFNSYDSLGEAYLAAGNQELALTNYKKSVELNPNNQGGRLAIKKIEGEETKVAVEILNTYVGKYEVKQGFVITITVENGELKAEPSGQSKVTLQPVSNTTFVEPSAKANIEFKKNENENVTSLILKQSGKEVEAKKIK